MRVLVVVHGFPPHAQGGAEIYAYQHARTLARQFGDDVHVLTREQVPERPEYEVRTEHRDGLSTTWINNTFRSVQTFEDSYRNDPIRRIAVDLIDTVRPDVAHVHHLTCLSTDIVRELDARRVPTIYTLHDYWLLCHRGQLLDTHYQRCAGPEGSGCHACLGLGAVPRIPSGLAPALRAIERTLPVQVAEAGRRLATTMLGSTPASVEADEAARRCAHMKDVCSKVTHFLAPSRSIRDRFIESGVDAGRVSVSPYGFDHAPFGAVRSGGSSPQASPSSSPLRLAFLGSLMISKAPHILLEAHRLMSPGSTTVDLFGAQVAYHGDASYTSTLAPLLAQPGVRNHGPRPHEEIASLLPRLDALVVTSIWPETSPLVIREAFLSGIPVIASRVGGIPELVEHDVNGLLVEPGDVEDLRRALARLVAEPGLLATLKMGAARTSVRTLDDDAAETRDLYERCVRELRTGGTGGAARDVRPPASAVVLNYRTPDDTMLAVSSLVASDQPVDIIVVDNDVEETCRARLRRFGPRVTYLPTGRNLGFAAGMNVGIRAALERGAERVLLVNSDVVVPPDCVTRLEDALTAAGDAIVGPLVLSRAFPGQVGSAGIDYNRRTGRMRHRGVGQPADRHGSSGDRDSVSGCLMLVPRAVFERVGLLDERYFFSFEEIEFCQRARQAGFATRIVGDAVAYHEGGRAMHAGSPRRLYFAARNHLLMASSTGARGGSRALRMLIVVGLNLAHALKAPGGSPVSRFGATLRGILDFLRGRFGPGPVS